MVAAQLSEIDARAAELADTRPLLVSVQSRTDRGEPIDVATLCSLIRQGHRTMDQQNWTPAGFDPEAYVSQWSDLARRIEAALSLDARGEPARALYREWQGEQSPPFPPRVWAFIKAVGAAQAQEA